MSGLPSWHPLIVHFPLALIVSGALCLTLARCLRIPPVPGPSLAATLATVGTWNLGIGAFALLLALGSGLAAAADLQVSAAAHQAISMHVKAAVVTALMTALVTIWRCVGVDSRSQPSWMFVIVLWIATASLVITGYRGAQNVYRFGVGVEAPISRAASFPTRAAQAS